MGLCMYSDDGGLCAKSIARWYIDMWMYGGASIYLWVWQKKM